MRWRVACGATTKGGKKGRYQRRTADEKEEDVKREKKKTS